MRRITDGFLSILGLLTRVPLGLRYSVDFSLAGAFMPVVGLIVWGVVCVIALPGGLVIHNPVLLAIVVLLVQYLLFNLFHFDGLLDTADAMLVFADREKRLRILKDVHHGSFALFGGVLYLAAKIVLLSEVLAHRGLPGGACLVALSYPVAGRLACGWLGAALPPATDTGLGASLGKLRRGPVLVGTLLSLSLTGVAAVFIRAAGGASPSLLLALVAGLPVGAFVSALTVGLLYRAKIGGITGDAYGCAVEVGEVACLAWTLAILRLLFL